MSRKFEIEWPDFDVTVTVDLLDDKNPATRKFEIEWPDFDVTVTVDLLDDKNPETCEEFWQVLPFDTIIQDNMSPGEVFLAPIPYTPSPAPPENLNKLPDEPPGSVNLLSIYLLITYGTVVEPFRVPRIGWIQEEDVKKLRSLAPKLREAYFFTKEVNIAKFRRKE